MTIHSCVTFRFVLHDQAVQLRARPGLAAKGILTILIRSQISLKAFAAEAEETIFRKLCIPL